MSEFMKFVLYVVVPYVLGAGISTVVYAVLSKRGFFKTSGAKDEAFMWVPIWPMLLVVGFTILLFYIPGALMEGAAKIRKVIDPDRHETN